MHAATANAGAITDNTTSANASTSVDELRTSLAPLHATFLALGQTLGAQPSVIHDASTALAQGDAHVWCMRTIQTLTTLAPAVRKSSHSAAVAAGAASQAHEHAALVLQYLTSLLHFYTMHQHTFVLAAASLISAPSSHTSLLPFLYAHLFKYCLNLAEYDTYYHFLTSMPATFTTRTTSTHHSNTSHYIDTSAAATSAASSSVKLEYLKRFLIELLREGRFHEILVKYNWNFDWQPAAANVNEKEDQVEEKSNDGAAAKTTSVQEEVIALLWWHAESSDLDDTSSSTTSTSSSDDPDRYYSLLFSFLVSSHLYLRAAQIALSYYYRLESEVALSKGLSAYIARKVIQTQSGKGRMVSSSIGAHTRAGLAMSHDQDAMSSNTKKSVTLALVRAHLQKKLWALKSVEYALDLAAAKKKESGEEAEVFMLEATNDSHTAPDYDGSPAPKRSRSQNRSEMNDNDDGDADDEHDAADHAIANGATSLHISSKSFNRIELLHASTLNRRVELLLAQFDLVDVLEYDQTRSSLIASLPPLDILEYADLNKFLRVLLKYGLIDRAFHFVEIITQEQKATKSNEAEEKKGDSYVKDEYEAIRLELFHSFAEKIVKLTRQLTSDDASVSAEVDDLASLHIEDSLQAIELSGKGSFSDVASFSSTAPSSFLPLRRAESVLSYLLDRYDSSQMRCCEIVSEMYLRYGIDIPIWLRVRYTKFMDADQEVDDEEEDHNTTMHRQLAAPLTSAHDGTLRSLPFLGFLRQLLAYNQYELLYTLTCAYLDWILLDAGREVSPVLTDVVDGFLYLQQEARNYAGDGSREVQQRVNEWMTRLREKLNKITGGNSKIVGNNFMSFQSQPVMRSKQLAATPAPASASLTPFTSRFSIPASVPAPTTTNGFAPAPSFTAALPMTSPFGFGANTNTMAPAAAVNPFTSTPAKSGFGLDQSAGDFSFSTPAQAAPVTASKTKTPSTTANLIFQTAFNATPAATTTSTPFSFGGFK